MSSRERRAALLVSSSTFHALISSEHGDYSFLPDAADYKPTVHVDQSTTYVALDKEKDR